MNGASPSTKPVILVAPLDWGLGHATRCIPVIHSLCTRGCKVVLAGEGFYEVILRSAFPQLPFLPLKGYRIRYAAARWAFPLYLAAQVPKMLRAIREENTWLQQAVREHGIQAVISDNRYGLYHPQIYSVIMTHQLQIQSGAGSWANTFLRNLHYHFLNRFQACWIPDAEGIPNLGGALAHPARIPAVPITYLGPLSRFNPNLQDLLPHYLLVLLSGPEPQRSLLERQLLQQAKAWGKPVLFVRGLPGHTGLPQVPAHITMVNHLPAHSLQQAIASASYVVARTGYSTVMDLAVLRKKSILIPTPGQTEQEYLARHLMQSRQALCIAQRKFSLPQAVALADQFPYQLPSFESRLDQAVQELLQQVGAG